MLLRFGVELPCESLIAEWQGGALTSIGHRAAPGRSSACLQLFAAVLSTSLGDSLALCFLLLSLRVCFDIPK